jgi:hypothetical protein
MKVPVRVDDHLEATYPEWQLEMPTFLPLQVLMQLAQPST